MQYEPAASRYQEPPQHTGGPLAPRTSLRAGHARSRSNKLSGIGHEVRVIDHEVGECHTGFCRRVCGIAR
jgi:hypothetical protein